MTPPKGFLALASVLLLQVSCVSSDTVNIDFRTAISNCSPDNGWSLVDPNTLPIPSKIYDRKVLKSFSFSCAVFPINVPPGTLVLSVYLKTDSDSRIEVVVRNDEESIINYVYDKNNIDFEQGWHTITLSIDKEITANVTLFGFSQNDDNIIVETIKYYDGQDSKSNWTQKLGDLKIIDLLSNNEIKKQPHNDHDNTEKNTSTEPSSYGSLKSNIIQHNNVFSIFYDGNDEIKNINSNENQNDKNKNILDDTILWIKENKNNEHSLPVVRNEGSTNVLSTQDSTLNEVRDVAGENIAIVTDIPEETATGGSTNAPEENATGGSTNAPEENATGGSTDEPEENATGGPTDAPEENATGGSTNAPEETATGGSTNAPEENATGGSTNAPEENATGGSTDEPEENATGGPTDAPEENATGGSTNAPEENATGGSTNAPEENATGGSTNAPEENATGGSTDAPEENATGGSTDAPEENATGGSTDAPEENATGGSTNAPEENATGGSTDAPEENATGGSTNAPEENATGEPTDAPSTNNTAPDEEVITDNPTDSESKENTSTSFWNILTIPLVAVASGSLVGLVVVSAYYLGKNSGGRNKATPIDLSDFEAPRIIPRAKTVIPPYQRFGGGSDYGYNSQTQKFGNF